MRREIGRFAPGPRGQHSGDVGQAAVERRHSGVDLHPIAGGQDHRLADVRLAQQIGQQIRDVGRGGGEALEKRDVRGPVRHTDDQQVHVATASESG